MLNMIAEQKSGKGIVIVGLAWYDFESDAIDEASGLCILRLTERDEKKWTYAKTKFDKIGVGELVDFATKVVLVRHSVMPWAAQEIGFLHSGEAKGSASAMSAYYHLQFDQGVVSHFRKLTDGALKVFVTGVLPGRILYAGSAVFGRDGTLLGVIADTESYAADAGRRAVVRSLLGHPKFTTFKKSPETPI